MGLRKMSQGFTISILLFIVTGLLVSNGSAYGQVGEIEDKTIDSAVQKEIIDSISVGLNEIYVFPDVAKKIEKHLRKKYKDKKYTEITSLREFTRQITLDLQGVNKDRHLGLRYLSDEEIAGLEGDTLTDQAKEDQLKAAQVRNFGFKEVKILDGNIGYINFSRFIDAEYAGPTAIAAMNFLGYTDAIIFDLRKNGGGSPSMIQLMSSYLFTEPVHLNSFYVRETDSVEQFWTQAFVEGPRLDKADVYVLTSDYTFSGAEEFTYNIKNLKRGTIIGEVTGGGAHPCTARYFKNLNCWLKLPYGRAINPISGDNWEQTGVKPDIEVPEEEAFDVAYVEALKKLKERITDEDRLYGINWVLDGKNAMLNPVNLTEQQARKYTGTFGPRKVTYENSELYYQRETNPKYKLIPMGNNRFMVDGLDYFRLKFVADDNGEFNEVIGKYDSGRVDGNKRGE